MEIGAQLYTVREFTQTLDDFAQTLKKIADIGYRNVQVSGTCAYEADWLKEQLYKNSLHCVLTHYNPDLMKADPEKVALKHKSFGCKYIGIGMIPGGAAGYDAFRDAFLNVSHVFAENDCLLMYHNHDFEFIKDNLIDRMVNDFPEREIGFTLDTYWIQAAGGDSAEWIRKLKGRVPCIHLKDMGFNDKMIMTPIYEGNMNFDAIIEACRYAGTEYLLVEQDECYGEDPFACLKRSFINLKVRGLH